MSGIDDKYNILKCVVKIFNSFTGVVGLDGFSYEIFRLAWQALEQSEENQNRDFVAGMDFKFSSAWD